MEYDLEEMSNLLVEFSRDGLEGYLTLIQGDDYNELSFKYEKVLFFLKEKIQVGLKDNVIKHMIDSEVYNESICIAEGIPPVNEKDGYIKYYFDYDKKLMPKLKVDGTVDYKDLNLVNNVNEGEVLAQITMPSGGKEGLKVTGEGIPYKEGKTPFFKYGKNVKEAEDGMYLTSTASGQVKLLNDKLVVLEVLEVPAVDNSTGNIDFNGSIKIKGNVVNGFELKADGDVEVFGVVEGADIKSSGDILIKQGIQGCNSGKIYSKRNIVTKFIENSYISCKRNLTVEAVMHSEVFCNETVNVIGKRGLLVGGICRARREIRAKTIGSRMETLTVLEVGVEPESKKKYEDLTKEISIMEKNLDKVKKSLTMLNNMFKSNKGKEKKQLFKKLEKTKIALEHKLDKLNREHISIKIKMGNLARGRIKVEDTIYPGVKIVIGDSVMFIREELSNCTFYRDEGEIKIGPY